MATIFERCEPGIDDLANDIIEKNHGALKKAGVRVDYLWARSEPDDDGEPTGDALKLHGYPVDGICKVVSPKDRALGRGDAEITLNRDRWDHMSHDEQIALLDHEITHIQLVRDANGHVKTDLYTRPVIRMRLHDRQHGWFDDIARRHGEASGEVQQAAQLHSDGVASIYFQAELALAQS